MNLETCKYNCSRNWTEPTSEPDITGIGIRYAYSITAVFAVSIVTLYYIFTYRPGTDAFADADENRERDPRTYRPNPIDLHFLSWRLQRKPRSTQNVLNMWMGSLRIHLALTKSMLMMSDLQLLTGLAIMVSGFVQLRACISIYHWEKLIHLAWFSCITHLSCSMFLRDHLRKNKNFQLWRIPGMIALVAMLLYVLATAAQFDWTLDPKTGQKIYTSIVPVTPAICYMHPRYAFSLDEIGTIRTQRRVMSMIFLVFGMVNRVQALYITPAQYALKVRRYISNAAKSILFRCYSEGATDSIVGSLFAIFIYRPLLAAFLTVRFCIDGLVSKSFEISWIVLGCTWGTTNLWISDWSTESESENMKWTFGQVMAIALLIVPFISLIEGFQSCDFPCPTPTEEQDDHRSNLTESAANTAQFGEATPPEHHDVHTESLRNTLPHNTTMRQPHDSADNWKRDSPDHDFYSDCYSFAPIIITTLATFFTMAIFLIFGLFPPLSEAPLLLLFHIYLCVLVAIVACPRRPKSRIVRYLARLACLAVYAWVIGYGSGSYFPDEPFKTSIFSFSEKWTLTVPMIGLYMILAIVDECRGWWDRRKRARKG